MGPKRGENSKAVAARERKAEKTNAEKAKKEKEAEDALWQDDDKTLAKKQARKDEAEKKRLEALEKKKEREALLAQEAETIVKPKPQVKKVALPPKITRAQIEKNLQEQQEQEAKAAAEAAAKKAADGKLTPPIVENLNRVVLEGETAATIEEAIEVLKITDQAEIDRHPEKRMKAAYEEFEKVRLPELKQENPSLRLSQLKQMLRKEWQKHPDNPINKHQMA